MACEEVPICVLFRDELMHQVTVRLYSDKIPQKRVASPALPEVRGESRSPRIACTSVQCFIRLWPNNARCKIVPIKD